MDDDELLRQIKIAEPCAVGWDTMQGDDRVRFCSSCNKHVYNLAAMPVKEAAALVRAKDGKLCGRILARDDRRPAAAGPRRPVRRGQFHIRLIMAVVAGVGALLGLTRTLWRGDEAAASPGVRSTMVMGVIACPPPPLPPTGTSPTECEQE